MHRDHHTDRQQAELATAEAKALNQHYMQHEGMDDCGEYFERLDATEHHAAAAAGRVQAKMGGWHG
ncbi:MAG: hypothetical protein ACI4QS_10860 [Comamonas sp.]